MPGLSFLLSPLGRILAAGVVVLTLLGGVYIKGHADGTRHANAACAAARAAEVGRIIAASTAAQEADKARAEKAEAAAAGWQAQYEDLAEDVRRRPPESVCTIGESDAKKLKAIR